MKWCTLICIVSILLTTSFSLSAQNISAKDLLKKSISYHDPSGIMNTKEVVMYFTETRPGGEDRKSSISFDIQKEEFSTKRSSEDGEIISSLKVDKATFSVDGSSDYSEEVAEKHRLESKRLTLMKNYYQYLWLLPMKLEDPGTIIDPEVKKVDFFGKELLQIRVTYSEEVGKDIWYFYFNPQNYALQGYRFYHDEAKNDGEYILLDGEVSLKKVKLPKSRAWYTHKEDKLLGTDILEELEF